MLGPMLLAALLHSLSAIASLTPAASLVTLAGSLVSLTQVPSSPSYVSLDLDPVAIVSKFLALLVGLHH